MPQPDRPIRVAHFLCETSGGAARVAISIHRGIVDAGCESCLIVGEPGNGKDRISGFGTGLISKYRRRVVPTRQIELAEKLQAKENFYPDQMGRARLSTVQFPFQPDIIHLHWVSRLLTSRDIAYLWHRFKAPIVWTVVDMHPMSGGCHYARDCTRFSQQCGACPILNSTDENDLSRQTWLSKHEHLSGIPITFVGATDWVPDRIRRSSLFKDYPVLKIPFGIDPERFRPVPQRSARDVLNLPHDQQIMFFGATYAFDERKGWRYLVEALNLLKQKLGAGQPPVRLLLGGNPPPGAAAMLPFPVTELGYMNDDRVVALAYQAADISVCPSIDDSSPLMMLEALMCGIPVVSFAACGGATDFIRNGINGWIAQRIDAGDLCQAIANTLASRATGGCPPEACRKIMLEQCTPQLQAQRYLDLYRSLLDQQPANAAR